MTVRLKKSATVRRLEKALADARRARRAADARIAAANRKIVCGLITRDSQAALRGREAEHDAIADRDRLDGLVRFLERELRGAGVAPVPDLERLERLVPGALDTVAAALKEAR